ncbi:MAG: hypothetical protein ACK4N5_14940 [Myxococcales bacterium]
MRHREGRAVASLAWIAVGLLAAAAGDAEACSGCPVDLPPHAVVPATGFPTNGRIRFRYPPRRGDADAAPALTTIGSFVALREDRSPRTVEVSFRHLPFENVDHSWFELIPDAPLQPDTAYELVDLRGPCGADAGVCDGAVEVPFASFRTASGPDTAAPSPVVVRAKCFYSCGRNSSCTGTASGFGVEFELEQWWKDARIEATARGPGFGPVTFEPTYTRGSIALEGPLHLYGNYCDGIGDPPTTRAPRGQLVVTLAARDHAGNVGVAPQAILIEHSACRCSARVVPADTDPQVITLEPCPDGECVDLSADAGPQAPPADEQQTPACGCATGLSLPLLAAAPSLVLPGLRRLRRRSARR